MATRLGVGSLPSTEAAIAIAIAIALAKRQRDPGSLSPRAVVFYDRLKEAACRTWLDPGPGGLTAYVPARSKIAATMVIDSGGSAADYERAPRRFLIVDAHPALRRSLACLIERRLDSHVVAEAASAFEGLQRAQECRPDIAIVDVCLDQTDGVPLMLRLADLSPNLRIVGYSFNDDCGTVSRFLATGGHAFVSKHEPTEALIEAIDCALAGKLRVAFSEPQIREDSQGEAETSA